MNDHTTHPNQLQLFFGKQCSSPTCRRAGQILPLSDFNVRRASPDGLAYKCKECCNAINAEYRSTEHGKKVRAKNQRDYSKRPNGRATDQRWHRKFRRTEKGRQEAALRRIRTPEKVNARIAVNLAVRRKDLPRADSLLCIQCGERAKEYHHHKGYAEEHWFDVVPTCKVCHPQLERSNSL